MRKLLIALSALAALGIAMPIMTGTAQADEKKIVIKRGHRHHDFDRHRHHAKVIIKKHGHDHDHD